MLISDLMTKKLDVGPDTTVYVHDDSDVYIDLGPIENWDLFMLPDAGCVPDEAYTHLLLELKNGRLSVHSDEFKKDKKFWKSVRLGDLK